MEKRTFNGSRNVTSLKQQLWDLDYVAFDLGLVDILVDAIEDVVRRDL